MQRGSGILMHISSLPSPYGIGTLGDAAYEFVDFLKAAGQKYWQVLPISPTGYGDSPYQSYSTFAGNPYFIDFEELTRLGNLSPDEYKNLYWGKACDKVDYEAISQNKIKVLRAAYLADRDAMRDKLHAFRAEESYWIENYAMFMALKGENDGLPYWEWSEELKLRKPEAMAEAFNRLSEELEFWVYVQYRFFEQWNKLRVYANENGIKIIGDIPIYVAEDSADAWARSDVLWLDENRRPVRVAGCPPDYFSPKGQLWGNPLYNWDYLKETNYEWWVLRVKATLKVCDIVRIDHFRAFSAYYAIPFGNEDAVEGEWLEGAGIHFFDVLKAELGGNPPIIAEDLGLMDDGVRNLLKATKFPGMKVLQFAFDPRGDSDYLPHKYDKNCVAYIGTHDNDTLLGWYNSDGESVQKFAKEYLRFDRDVTEGFFAGLMSSVADVAIVTMQDILKLDETARMNTPGVMGGNWQWRLKNNSVFTDDTAKKLAAVTRRYGR